VTVIDVAELTVNVVAATVPKRTEVAPNKLVPVTATVAPGATAVGAIALTVGRAIVKAPVDVTVPLALVIDRRPAVVPTGTTAEICVAETTVKLVACVVLKVTRVTPIRLVPAIVTVVPIATA
jgi:hypothetical protein